MGGPVQGRRVSWTASQRAIEISIRLKASVLAIDGGMVAVKLDGHGRRGPTEL